MTSQKVTNLSNLKQKLKDLKLDYLLLPNSDEFANEYLPDSEKRLEFITGFSGSNAYAIICQNKSAFFTDGRYTIQAQQQVDGKLFEIYNLSDKTPTKWLLENLKPNSKIAFDPKLHSKSEITNYQQLGLKLTALYNNLVDTIWKNKPQRPNSKIFIQQLQHAGLTLEEKCSKIIANLNRNNTNAPDALILNSPASICWLLNIRATDVAYTPLILCYAIIYKDGKIELFIDQKRLNNQQVKQQLQKITILAPQDLAAELAKLYKKSVYKVQLDPTCSSYWLYSQLLANKIDIVEQPDPCLINKACKNKAEIAGAVKAHQLDGLAVTKFLFWLEKSVKNQKKIDEISAAKQLLQFRKLHKDFLYPSFNTISAFGSNGAIIHYAASQASNKQFSSNSLYLVDSGGQYPFGTTDITRTIAIGNPTSDQIDSFTRVLKGHIAIAQSKFPVGTTGSTLDILARYHLWQKEKDYDHGTGHGVGSFLSVHEGPQAISTKANCTALKAGMILSNEPGYYKKGEYGIRIESLLIVQTLEGKRKKGKEQEKEFLHFKTLTLAPIDHRLINFKILTYTEKKWLKNYHLEIYQTLANKLNKEEKLWLKKLLTYYEH